jgi:hypothetical protein
MIGSVEILFVLLLRYLKTIRTRQPSIRGAATVLSKRMASMPVLTTK